MRVKKKTAGFHQRFSQIDVLQQLFHSSLGLQAHALVGDGAILEHHQGGDAHYAELHGQLGVLVDVDLADLHLTSLLLSQLIHDGSHHAAGTAPGCPEIHQNGDIALQDLLLEVCFIYSYNAHFITLLFISGAPQVSAERFIHWP